MRLLYAVTSKRDGWIHVFPLWMKKNMIRTRCWMLVFCIQYIYLYTYLPYMHVTDIRSRSLYVVLNFRTVSGECLDIFSMYSYCMVWYVHIYIYRYVIVYGVCHLAFGFLIGMCQRPESRLYNYSMWWKLRVVEIEFALHI